MFNEDLTWMQLMCQDTAVAEVKNYAKGWFRSGGDNRLYLYKTYGGAGNEVEKEVCALTKPCLPARKKLWK